MSNKPSSSDKTKNSKSGSEKPRSNDRTSEKSNESKQSEKSPRKDGRADHVVVRNLFALNITRRAVFLALLSVVCAGLSLLSAYQVFSFKTPPQYIQLTEDGRIFPVAPLSVPNVSEGEIVQFATDSVKWINTYDFKSWRDQLQVNSSRFTPKGWGEYLEQLTITGTLNTMQAKKMVVSPSFTGPPQVLKQGVVSNGELYTWVVEVPVQVNLEAASTDKNATNLSQKGVVTLYIVRVPLEVNLRGYAIAVYQFAEKS